VKVEESVCEIEGRQPWVKERKKESNGQAGKGKQTARTGKVPSVRQGGRVSE